MKNFIRAFFAIDLPSVVKKKIQAFIADLEKEDTHHLIRWRKPNQLHFTLQFMEKVDMADLPLLTKHVNEEIKELQSFSFGLSELELFPSPHHPKVISFSVDANDKLTEVSQAIGRGIQKTNYPIETRPFRAHLTLGRFNRAQKSFQLTEKKLPDIKNIFVKEIILFQSKSTSEGSNYIPLEKFLMRTK